MSYRDILVQLDGSSASEARARVAASIAQRWGCTLTGVFLKSDFVENYFVGEGLAYLPKREIEAMIGEHASSLADHAERAFGHLRSAAGACCVTAEFEILDGDRDEALVALTRRTDLTVFPTWARACLGRHEISAADLSMASGAPVLVLPQKGYSTQIGRRVLVAWNGSREAARALRDAWPFLEDAETVRVVVASGAGDGPDSGLEHHLSRHGVGAEIVQERAEDHGVSRILHRHAADMGADLVVMGIYGHARLQEMVLGGVSQDMLHDPPAPLLISH